MIHVLPFIINSVAYVAGGFGVAMIGEAIKQEAADRFFLRVVVGGVGLAIWHTLLFG